MAVEGSLSGDPRKVYQAIAFDPLTSAVLGIQEIKEMTEKMFLRNKDYLPQFSSIKGKL
jgi:alpha-galactosidase